MNRVGLTFIAVGSLAASSTAAAAGRLALFSVGNCRERALAQASFDVGEALRAVSPRDVVREDEVQRRLRPRSALSASDLHRRLDEAQFDYFQARYREAEERVFRVQGEIEALGVGPDRWALFVRAELLLALILRGEGRDTWAGEALRRVLRLDPSLELDPDYYPPSLRRQVDETRTALAKEIKHPVEVSSSPAGADVFLDGRRVGTTPYAGRLVRGEYHLSLRAGDATSLVHRLTVSGRQPVHVNLAFESGVGWEGFSCVGEIAAGGAQPSDVVPLALELGADELILIRVERGKAGGGWLEGALLETETGQKKREGRVRTDGSETAQEAVLALARFLANGEASGAVEPVGSGAGSSRADLETERTWANRSWRTPLGIGLLGVGALCLGAGTVLEAQSAGTWAEFNRAYAKGAPSRSDLPRVAQLQDRATSEQALGVGGLAVGILFAAGGTWALVADRR